MASIRLRNDKYQVLVRLHGIPTSKKFIKKSYAQRWAKATDLGVLLPRSACNCPTQRPNADSPISSA
jgi:hypothetical protein